VTLHIPSTSRIKPVTNKSSGRSKRPRYSLTNLLTNLHLLLRVPSFSRWPLDLRFFAPDVHSTWSRLASRSEEKIRDSIAVITDFPNTSPDGSENSVPLPAQASAQSQAPKLVSGVQGLDVTHTPLIPHLAKSRDILEFEQEGSCSICSEVLPHQGGIYTICPHEGCNALSHISCLSRNFIASEEAAQTGNAQEAAAGNDDFKLPVSGKCASCGRESKWVDIVKETAMRSRGGEELDKLLKPKRVKAMKDPKSKKPVGRPKKAAAMAGGNSGSDTEDEGRHGALQGSASSAAVLAAGLAFSSDIEADDESDLSDLDAIFAEDLDGINGEDKISLPRPAALSGGNNGNISGGGGMVYETWHEIEDSEDDGDSDSNVSVVSFGRPMKGTNVKMVQDMGNDIGTSKGKNMDTANGKGKKLVTDRFVIDDSDWDDTEVIY
jgi:hypothetical protein